MNKCIKRLVESLFDDDFDDIVNLNHNDEVTTIAREMIKIKLPYCESYLSKQCGGEHVYTEADMDTDTVAFYTKDGRNKKNYLNMYLITTILTWIREIFGFNLVGLIMKQLLLNQ